jgi:hypothetical protein
MDVERDWGPVPSRTAARFQDRLGQKDNGDEVLDVKSLEATSMKLGKLDKSGRSPHSAVILCT